MHSIKHQARSIAWRSNDEEYVNYDPFAKRSRSYVPRRAPDEEAGLVPTQPVPGEIIRSSSCPNLGLPSRRSDESIRRIDRRGPLRSRIQDLGELKLKDDRSDKKKHTAFDEILIQPVRVKTSDSRASRESASTSGSGRTPWVAQAIAVLGSWSNLLLLFVPAGFAVQYAHCNSATTFSVNFVAIFPCADILEFAVDELAMYLGDRMKGLLSMTFSNAVQLITSVLLLRTRQIRLLQISLLGSILESLLLMTGLGFFFGGINRTEQYFNATVAQTIDMLLLLATLSLIVPTVSHLLANVPPGDIVAQSRGMAVVVIFSYGLYLYFQLVTNRGLFNEPPRPGPKAAFAKKEKGETLINLARIGAGTAAVVGGEISRSDHVHIVADDVPSLTVVGALITMVVSTTLLTFNTLFATESIQGVLLEAGLTETFVGLVLLPLLSSDPSSIVAAVKDRMDLSIGLTLERCMQTSLMVVPSIVLLAWCMDIDEMTLQFDGFLAVSLFAAIIIVTYIVQEGRSNWLTGALLIKVFVIISIAAFFII